MADENPRRRVARPPIDPDDPTIKVTISLQTKLFDRYCAVARHHDLSVHEVIRRALASHARRRKEPDKTEPNRPRALGWRVVMTEAGACLTRLRSPTSSVASPI